MPALDLPRSVVLAAWLAAPHDVSRTLRAVQREDEPHALAGPGAPGEDLASLLTALGDGPRQVACVLPAPGEPGPLPPAVSGPATAAGEAVLLRGDLGCVALVPEVRRFGSRLEPGHLVRWDVVEVDDWRTGLLGTLPTLAEADRALRTGLAAATSALTRLDVARWRPGLQDDLAALREDSGVTRLLPPDLDPPRVRLLVSAARLRAVVDLATVDDGGAVMGWQADQRSTALREVEAAARRATAAAVTSDLSEPA